MLCILVTHTAIAKIKMPLIVFYTSMKGVQLNSNDLCRLNNYGMNTNQMNEMDNALKGKNIMLQSRLLIYFFQA